MTDSFRRGKALSLAPDVQDQFLLTVALNLTLVGRSKYAAEDSLKPLQGINELVHIIVGQLSAKSAGGKHYPLETLLDVLSEQAATSGIDSDVQWAIDTALQKFERKAAHAS